MLVQADRDAADGLKTGGFVSGYRGSPLGTLDTAFASARPLTQERGIVVQPSVNEELAATAVAGTQQIAQTSLAKVDGVFALWYGKGPGLDRASDAVRHGNYQGASPRGGVVLAIGDDHVAKSSSIICYSDEVVAGLQVPLFYPADAGEIVAYGLHGFAVSRHTGSWTALKIITEVADATRTVVAGDALDQRPVLPAISLPSMGLHNRWPETPQDQETRQINHRLPAVVDYVRANKLDRIHIKEANARFGLIAAGKSWLDLLEALRLLGLDDPRLIALGIALYKPAMIWPLEPTGLCEFAAGIGTLIVIEEKGEFIERQAKSVLYGTADAPRIWGKQGAGGAPLFPATGDLTPEKIAAGLGALIASALGDGAVRLAAARAEESLGVQVAFAIPPTVRKPFFCSGCPHNRSTVLPEGSRATAGIGCHGLAAYNHPATGSFAQMGGEGIHWMGLSPFTDEKHIFANMGDGTYFHSGLLAIRQAVASKLNITYKLLYNSAVAMTGGQAVDGELSVLRVVDQLRAEGVTTIVISTEETDRYPTDDPVRAKVERVDSRDDLEALQRELRVRPGVSVILYDQMCATEKRRLRKRGKLQDSSTRAFINELVCEGCGDCSVKSNCLSVEPVDTEFGTKRRVNQSSCNKDYSCLNGFCPSFVTVEGGKPKEARNLVSDFDATALPMPAVGEPHHERILVAGIGGTGVVTIGALVAMATHMSGRSVGVLDQVGMAQKGGAVISHIHIADERITALRVPVGEANLVIVCDQVVGNMRDVMAAIAPGTTRVVVNTDVSITGDFTQNRNAAPDATLLLRRLAQRAGAELVTVHPFTRLSERLFGDAIASNLMLVGLAWQKGWISLNLAAVESAIDLNGAAVAMNKAAFAWGRRLAVAPDAVYVAAGLKAESAETETLEQLVTHRAAFLTAYQNEAYAERFRASIVRIRDAERLARGDGTLSATAAKALFRLMAYKDEYEVARLFTDRSFAKAIDQAFEGKVKLSFHMAPPMLSRRDKATGHPRKRRFGFWIMPLFRILAHGKRLRGTAFDPFGRTLERREERRIIVDYESMLARLGQSLKPGNLGAAEKIAGMALEVRGYGHVKRHAMMRYNGQLAAALATFESPDDSVHESLRGRRPELRKSEAAVTEADSTRAR
jgi:indolepyruvate ferredoxin oxidoreductase